MLLHPQDFIDREGPWEIDGEVYTNNPAELITSDTETALQLWQLCRDKEGGLRHLPDNGGAAEQPCALLRAFAVMEAALTRFRKQ